MSLVSLVKDNISVVAVSKLLTSENNEKIYNIPGYKFMVRYCPNVTGGRIGLFVSKSYNFRLRDDSTGIIMESVII